MTQIWRLNIKTDSKEGIDPRSFCIKRNILGIGWQVEHDGEYLEWGDYDKLAREKYYAKGDKGWWPAINAIKNRMAINDLCWTRDTKGIYYLGRITGEWRYQFGKDYEDRDVVNIRDCSWKRVGSVDAVPGKVVNSFIPARTVQLVDDPAVLLFSLYKHNELEKNFLYEIPTLDSDLFSLLSAEDCEDVVGLYLQSLEYHFIASSCKADTLTYEYVLKHKETGKKAFAQVKDGFVDLDAGFYSDLPGEVYLFTSRGRYIGTPAPNVHCIQRDILEMFIRENYSILPDRIQTWINMHKKLAEVSG